MKNIVLTGFMASGKTTIGKRLADVTGFKFIDTDLYIEEKENKTINEIFQVFGEEYFRDLEEKAILECSSFKNSVIACGGGTVLREENIKNLRKNGIIFNLNPTIDVIKSRIKDAAKTRPLMDEGDIEGTIERFLKRIPYYENCDYKIDVTQDKSIECVLDEILNIYNSLKKDGEE